MAKPKTSETKTKADSIREKLEEISEAKQEQRQSQSLDEDDTREAFRKYWALNKQSFKQSKDVEEIVWLHLKAIKHNTPDLFEQGVINFGFKK
jgi:hypothetical protein